MKRIALSISAVFSLLLASCSSATIPDSQKVPDDKPEEGLVSIAYLKTLCNGISSTITKDISIAGTVVAHDLFGEFYKTMVIVDDSGGIEIDIDRQRLFVDFPIYTRIEVSCNGLALGRVGGKTVLGAMPTGEYTVDRIGDEEAGRHIIPSAGQPAAVAPQTVTIPELSVEHISSYVRIDGVKFENAADGLPWCDITDGEHATTDRRITDRNGNTLIVRTSGKCSYAAEYLPTGEGSVVGILDYAADRYILRIANHGIMF